MWVLKIRIYELNEKNFLKNYELCRFNFKTLAECLPVIKLFENSYYSEAEFIEYRVTAEY